MTEQEFNEFVERLVFHNRGKGVDAHITAHPIFLVEKKVKDYGMDPEYTDKCDLIFNGEYKYKTIEDAHSDFLDDDEKADLDAWCIKEHGDKWGNLSEDDQIEALEQWADDFRACHYVERWEYVNSHFTKEAAQAFIKRKGHDYPEGLRIFVDSQYWCPEFNMIVEAILDGTIGFVKGE